MNKEIIENLILYVMNQANKQYVDDFPINEIEIWIRDYFNQNQPDSSKREDT